MQLPCPCGGDVRQAEGAARRSILKAVHRASWHCLSRSHPAPMTTMSEQSPPSTILPAVSVAIFHDGRFLLVKRGREPSKGFYAFPGGRVDAGEADEDAARRELAEETGLTIA